MSTRTASPAALTKYSRPWVTRTLPRATVTIGIVAAGVTTACAALARAAGVPLVAHGEIPLAAFAQLTFIGAIMGGALLAGLIRRSAAPRQKFVRITVGLTALSCVAPAAFAETASGKIALVAVHLVAAAIIIPFLARFAD